MTPGKWTVSTNEESWPCDEEFDTKDLAIAAAADVLDLEPGGTFYVGRARKPEPHELDAEHIIPTWLEDVTQEQEDELSLALNKVWLEWIKKHGLEPPWFVIGEVETRHADDPEIEKP